MCLVSTILCAWLVAILLSSAPSALIYSSVIWYYTSVTFNIRFVLFTSGYRFGHVRRLKLPNCRVRPSQTSISTIRRKIGKPAQDHVWNSKCTPWMKPKFSSDTTLNCTRESIPKSTNAFPVSLWHSRFLRTKWDKQCVHRMSGQSCCNSIIFQNFFFEFFDHPFFIEYSCVSKNCSTNILIFSIPTPDVILASEYKWYQVHQVISVEYFIDHQWLSHNGRNLSRLDCFRFTVCRKQIQNDAFGYGDRQYVAFSI